MRPERIRDEAGAEAIEFALIAPLVLGLIFAIVYGLLVVAAHLTLAHGTSIGVRYATMPTDPVTDTYPTEAEVEARIVATTPFFSADSCATTVAGDRIPNAPVSVEVSCTFPNPAGAVLDGLFDLFTGDPDVGHTVGISAHGQARRE